MFIFENSVNIKNASNANAWTPVSIKYSYSPSKPGVGPGEEKLAAELGGKIMGGSTSYDIVLPNGEKVEVKQLDTSGLIRPGTKGLSAVEKNLSIINQTCNELSQISINVLRLQSTYPESYEDFIMHDIPFIKKGEITPSRMMGSTKKFGLLQALQFINYLMKNNKDGADHTVVLDKKKKVVSDITFAQVVDIVDPEDSNYKIDPLNKQLSKAKSYAFQNPQWIIDEIWTKAAIPSDVFSGVDALAIVDQKGYRIIPAEQFDDVLQFVHITQGKPKFKVL